MKCMKRVMALLLCVMLLGSVALPTLMVSADVEGRVIKDLTTFKSTISKKVNTDKYVCGPSTMFEATDLSGYSLNNLAVEADFYFEGDLTAFKNGMDGSLELTSSGTCDDQELNWNMSSVNWQADKWFRATFKLSAAGKSGAAIDLKKVNYMRMYLYSAGSVNKTIIFKYCNVRIVDLSKGAVGTDPVGDGTFKVNAPDWKLIDTTYDTTEAIIAGYNLGDYLAPNTDADATPALQTLMDSLNAAGGGTVYVPAGTYTLKGTLQIPYGVTLQGDWRAPTAEHPEAVGTIFKVYAGKGNDKGMAFITMLPNSEVQGITFWYPEQDVNMITPYPVTIKMYKEGNWGADYTHVRNCTFVNSYRAVQQGPAGSGCPNVYNIYGTPLFVGTSMDNIADIGRFDYINFAPSYWEQSGLTGAPTSEADKATLEAHLLENATALKCGRVDWSYWSFGNITGYKVAMDFVDSEGDPGATANGQVYGMHFKNCGIGIQIDGISSGAAEVFANINIEKCKVGIHMLNNPNVSIGNINMNFITIDADTAILHEGVHHLFFNASTVKRGTIVLAGGLSSITGCTFETAAPQVNAKTGTKSVILQDNEATSGEFNVENPSMCPMEISDDPIVMDEIDLMTGDQSTDKTVKAAREVLYVADFDKTGKTDVTAALQALLTKAGTEGGGYVFLPGGFYRLNGSVTVPSGVELVGAVDIGRNPFRIGTVIEVCGRQADATVILSANSGLRGVVFDYPEQSNSMDTLKTYPYTVQGRGENIYLVNVAIRNGFDGVDLMTNRCDNHYVKYLAGYCFHSVIKVGGGSVGGKIINYQMNSSAWWSGDETKYGSWPNSPNNAERTETTGGAWKINNLYVQTNCVILTVGDVTDQVLYNNFSYLGAVGAKYVEENGKGANGWNVGNAYDYSTVGLQVDGIGDMDFINVQIVSYNYAGIEPTTHHVYLSDKCDDTVNVIGLACWARPHNYLRVDGGKLNVYCGSYTDNAANECFASVAENAKLYVLDGAITNGGVKRLADGTLKNLTMSGFFNIQTLQGQENSNWGHNLVRVTRWDVPTNAAIDTTQKMFFTEAFTDYATETSNEIPNVLVKDGTFNVVSDAKAGTNVTLVSEGDNDMARIFHDGTAQAAYLRNSTLRMTSGKVNCRYQMETRLNIKSLRDNEYANFVIMVYNMSVSAGSPVQLMSFKPDGIYMDDQKLAAYTENTWYRVQIGFDLTNTGNKTYKVTLLDDSNKVLATSASIPLPESYQNNANGVGVLNMTATADVSTSAKKNTEVLVDYVYVTQDPTVVSGTMLGDVDGDEKITTTDARLTLQFAAEKITADKLDTTAADVDKNTEVTTTDARMILQYAAQKITSFD